MPDKEEHEKEKIYISHVLKKDLAFHMKKALIISRQDWRLCSEVKNVFYTENQHLFSHIYECTNAYQTIVPTYLHHPLEIPDSVARCLGQNYAVPPHEEYYCIMFFFWIKGLNI